MCFNLTALPQIDFVLNVRREIVKVYRQFPHMLISGLGNDAIIVQ